MPGVLSNIVQRDPGVARGKLASVIIPAYNAARYIQEALESVFAQTYSDYEVIVVNDGSPDTQELESITAPYLNRVIYITQENRGLAGARNTGLRAAKGEFVALLDADDIWLPDYLSTQVRFLEDHPDFDLAYCNAIFFGDSVYAGREYMAAFPSEGDATASAIISRRCHVFVSVTARRDALRAVGFDEALRSCEDFDCWIRFAAAGYRIGYHREVLVRYRKHRASLSTNAKMMAEFNLKVLTKSLSYWPENSKEIKLLRKSVEDKKAELEMIEGKLALRDRDAVAARTHFLAANTHYKSPKLALLIVLLRLFPALVRMTYILRGLVLPVYRAP